jgi:hypothetical protein
MAAMKALLIALVCVAPAMAWAADYDRVSPFDMVRWSGDSPEVRVGKVWYGLVSIEGVATADVLAHCKRKHGSRWDKRFCEDLVQVFAEMRKPLGKKHVTLVVRDLSTGKERTLTKVAMSEDNRDAIWKASPRAGAKREPQPEEAQPPSRRAQRKHNPQPDPRYAFLTRRVWEGSGGKRITASDAQADLDQLEGALEDRFSYLTRAGVDHRAALDTLRAKLGKDIDLRDFHIQLCKLVALFRDGHSRVRRVSRALPRGFLPCALRVLGDSVVAMHPEGRALLRSKRPLLTAIDGVPLARWLKCAGRLEGLTTLGAQAENLIDVAYLRQELDLPPSKTVRLTLSALQKGKKPLTVTLALAGSPSFSGKADFPRSALLKGTAYLRIPSMGLNDEEVQQIVRSLERLRAKAKRGLILDVRGNGGGSRGLLIALYPYLVDSKDPPRVRNVSAYRLPPGTEAGRAEGYLEDRYLHPLTSSHWSAKQREAIEAFVFEPKWKLPKQGFSAWHYLVLGPVKGVKRFPGKVAVLIDRDCFSATDIFVGALKGLPGVTLFGQPTGGGSGRSRQTELEKSGFKVRLSSMASYLPSGHLFEERGVQPDVVTQPGIKDILGKRDTTLLAAQRHLRKR